MRCRQGLWHEVPIFLNFISWPYILKKINIKNLNGPGYNQLRNIILELRVLRYLYATQDSSIKFWGQGSDS